MVSELLAGRTAVVTGGGNGIGAAIARALVSGGALRGAVVDLPGALHGDSPAGWQEFPLDLRDEGAAAAVFAEITQLLGPVHVLVLAAGIVPRWSGVRELDLGVWDDVFSVNVRGMLLAIQGLAHAMPAGGSIVAIASDNAWRGNPRLAGYSASKHAVVGLVRSVAMELGSRGVRVNAIAPGPVATEAHLERMRTRERELGIAVEAAVATAGSGAALGRMATAEEIATTALFLASDLSSGIDGQLIRVDAGAL